MVVERFWIRRLVVRGAGRSDAELDFSAGLNLLTGFSNTGKTYVVECIDYALGASEPPRSLHEARGYDHVLLEIVAGSAAHTIIRTFPSTDTAVIADSSIADWDGVSGEEVKVKVNPKSDARTLSRWLVERSGFDPKTPVIKNARGQRQSLSFRGIAPFVTVTETDVIKEGSPVLTENPTQHTASRSMFRLFLTGLPPTDEIASLRAAYELRDEASHRAKTLAVLIDQAKADVSEDGLDRQALEDEAEQIDQQIAQLAETVAASGEALRTQIDSRKASLLEASRARSRATALTKLEARFRLLRQHYKADVERLEFVLEGGHFFRQIAATHCPTCEREIDPEDDDCHPESASFEQIEAACRAEIGKVQPRLHDLERAIEDTLADLAAAEAAHRSALDIAASTDAAIQRSAAPTASSARTQAQVLTGRRREIGASLAHFRDLDRYTDARDQAITEARAQLARYRPEQDLAALDSLTTEVKALLDDWRYPTGSGVRFDLESEDLVIDGKGRADNGKGVRAITHAAFTVGLLNMCLKLDLPHPGIAIIDSPLTPFKGPSDDDGSRVSSAVHTAFLWSLSRQSNRQTIIIENVDPPDGLDRAATVHEFTGDSTRGRKAFFPEARDPDS